MNLSEILIKALTTTLLGMSTVFVLLIIISLIISWLRYIPLLLGKLQKSKQPTSKEVEPSLAPATASADEGRRLAAIITAAITASETEHGHLASGDSYVVRNIRRLRH